MSLSIFTTVTNPIERGDLYNQALMCYSELADEVVIVNGSDKPIDTMPNVKVINRPWPKEFKWDFIGQQFQTGYEACSGDWVIRMDLDMLFHERDYLRIKHILTTVDTPVISFYKRQFIVPDRFNVKSRIILAVNKKMYSQYFKFTGGGDMCQLTIDGRYIEPGEVFNPKIPLWNYECILKTKEQLMEDKGRFARAWQAQFGEYRLGGPDDQSAYNEWYGMVKGRFSKPQQKVPLDEHPRLMRDVMGLLKPEQFGYNGFGLIKGGVYA